MRARCVLTGPLLLRHGELRARAAPDVFGWRGARPRCARLLRVSAHRIALPALPQVWSHLLACWSDRMEPQLAARPPPVAASSQRQEPCEPARHGGTLLGPLVLDPGAPELDRRAVAPAWALEVSCGALECRLSRCARSAARARRTLCIVPGKWHRECGGMVCVRVRRSVVASLRRDRQGCVGARVGVHHVISLRVLI